MQQARAVVAIVLALAALAMGHMHDMGDMHGMDHMPMGNGKHCPICNMNAEDAWYIEMKHGQRLFTCSMTTGDNFAAGIHAFSHPALLGAAMSDYVATDVTQCAPGCADCSNNTTLLDPVSGATITSDNARFLCFARGQKLYFASETTKSAFAAALPSQPYFGVQSVMCGGRTCPDAFQVPAQVVADAPFCTGASVMLSGFQSTVHGTCVKLFFQSWVLDTPFKYALAFTGIFLLPLGNEYLVQTRESIRMAFVKARSSRYNSLGKRSRKLILTLLYMVQMTLAYFAMLVVMIYDTGLFFALILGFGVGFALFKSEKTLSGKSSGMVPAAWRFDDTDSLTVLSIGGMMCMQNCGNTVQNALELVPGVHRVFIGFNEKCAYVSGTATTKALCSAIEDCGFEVNVVRPPKAETPSGYGAAFHLA
ncbi:hypothetical protein SDRG_09832 [Saprolegnia diclina VS20]|uniref:Copper transport protein n=1 Tax=Saprolegnia diclina (strain VS20) TaxID=1156394 RepID=T0QCU4_SAPDV|nr:hypothetical protein SDRG_09832 [Saprolegnia diclina VS20]EQC32506.1 hypothetical protein SDRG_09832 [Saprolegnia diclina VS20]|eukprot:XP_008614007.1 hypothetical protein SDRG_09832 [Saprolegnia diclina VS20]